MQKNISRNHLSNIPSCNKVFFDDIVDLFMGFRSGHLGKYAYGSHETDTLQNTPNDNWDRVVSPKENSYSLPNSDNELLAAATPSIHHFIPLKTSLLDFGVGETSTFYEHALPILQKLKSQTYYGVDFCQPYLDAVKCIKELRHNVAIETVNLDFFEPQTQPIASAPSVGLMMCSTIGNIDGNLAHRNITEELVSTLRNLSMMTKQGWLLLSVDTNQDPNSLALNYRTKPIAQFVISIFDHMLKELPVTSFDSQLFNYEPEWIPDLQLFAHIVEAKESQYFSIDKLDFHIEKGQKFHLLNSHKFSPTFFEECCNKANLEVINVWHHPSAMKLYLLEDRANPYHLVKEQGMQDLLAALAARDARNAGFGQNFTQAANLIGTRTTHHAHREARRTSRS